MLFGLGLGLIVAIGVYLVRPAAPNSGAEAQRSEAAAPAPRPAPKVEPATAGSADENRFEFYEILPQLEVEVPEAGERTTRPARPRAAEVPGSFLLQVGSFSAPADADRLQANLALLGFESHIQRVKIEDTVFNRVRIGPLADAAAAERAQRRLRDAGIDALLMRVPN
jgi:cell division protein FtsN